MKAASKRIIPMIMTPVIAGIVLSVLGPFGTIQLPFTERLTYWVGLCIAGGFGAGFVEFIFERTQKKWAMWQEALGQSVGATVCVTTVMFILFPPNSLPNILITLFYVWVISIVLCFVGALLHNRRNETAALSLDQRPPLLDRLPPKLRHAEIYAISAEDHYVRVHSSAGDEMILMRLSDAVREAAPLAGLQTHRSWWVAEKGVEAVEKKNGKISLALKNGLTAPVSRSGQSQVREAGWV